MARRVYSIRLSIAPAFLTYPLRLPEGAAQVLFANSINLLPSTFCAYINGQTLQLHVLDKRVPVVKELEMLEFKIASIFGMNLNEANQYEAL
ncbi:MAG: Na+/H+ antiporter subunit E [Thiotrichaceae bacterium]|nr:Na+/H+ antiporter subunit E [Thiotrichaceae bacterium]